MGAIIGRLSFEAEEILARTVVDQMLDASVRHPVTARTVFAAPGIALGWCGLPSTESRGAKRNDAAPAIGTNDNRTVRVVADACLTNAGELRTTLERDGHRFPTCSDEELIAHAYDHWGTRAFELSQ